MTEDLLINMLLSRQANTQQCRRQTQIAKFEASRPGMFAKHEIWTLHQIIYPLPKDPAVTAKIAAAKTLDEVAQALDRGRDPVHARDQAVRHARCCRRTSTRSSATLQPGEPFIAPGPDKAVASVITARQPAPLHARSSAAAGAVADAHGTGQPAGSAQRVKELKAKAKIQYQPGFAPPKS